MRHRWATTDLDTCANMSAMTKPERLSGLDTSFLHLERSGAHMHVASVSVFKGEAPSHQEFRDHIGSRLHLVPRFRQKLRQVLINLMSNACKFTSGGRVRLVVDQDGQGWLELRVIDTGIGMSDEQRARLFRPFVQADSSTTRRYGGTGLGLAISQRFCEMMGGRIEVTSRPEQGSTFTVRLPAAVNEPGAALTR